MKPSLGQIVYYTAPGDSEGRGAGEVSVGIITRVNDDGTVGLHLLNTFSVAAEEKALLHFLPAVRQSTAVAGSDAARGCWW
jgi:hypothetical protein